MRRLAARRLLLPDIRPIEAAIQEVPVEHEALTTVLPDGGAAVLAARSDDKPEDPT